MNCSKPYEMNTIYQVNSETLTTNSKLKTVN